MKKTIGTIIHGALGDCYEQLWSIRQIRTERTGEHWIGFFADDNRFNAMVHFDLTMFDEVLPLGELQNSRIDEFFQFQINDQELRDGIIGNLPEVTKRKFDFSRNLKPWHFIRAHDFDVAGSHLELSAVGQDYLPECMRLNEVSAETFRNRFTVGYMWRYRDAVGPTKGYLARSKDWVLSTKNDLFNTLIDQFGAHVIVAGMKKDAFNGKHIPEDIKRKAAFVEGEYRWKVADDILDIPSEHSTFLKGLGYAQEMEIMAKCDLLLVMASGFSEPLWMRYPQKTVLLDPLPLYSLKLIYNRMPLFNNMHIKSAIFNNFVPHTADNVIGYLRKQKLLV